MSALLLSSPKLSTAVLRALPVAGAATFRLINTQVHPSPGENFPGPPSPPTVFSGAAFFLVYIMFVVESGHYLPPVELTAGTICHGAYIVYPR